MALVSSSSLPRPVAFWILKHSKCSNNSVQCHRFIVVAQFQQQFDLSHSCCTFSSGDALLMWLLISCQSNLICPTTSCITHYNFTTATVTFCCCVFHFTYFLCSTINNNAHLKMQLLSQSKSVSCKWWCDRHKFIMRVKEIKRNSLQHILFTIRWPLTVAQTNIFCICDPRSKVKWLLSGEEKHWLFSISFGV